MSKFLTQAMFYVGAAIPVMAVLGSAFVVGARRFGGTRAPATDKLLRGAGESLRREIEQFEEKFLSAATRMVGLALVCGLLLSLCATLCFGSSYFVPMLALGVVAIGGLSYFAARRAVRAAQRYWNNVTGFRGERAVGGMLDQLMLDGCRVFHDVPGDGDWNIDHVIIAPRGVFAVETKTRRKLKGSPGNENHKVSCDGQTLKYPHATEEYGIAQAKNNAHWLGEYLTKALAEPIRARPILALPGWLVNRTVSAAEAGIFVGNPKEIRKLVTSDCADDGLTQKQIDQIANRLRERCSDVEF